MAIEKEYVLGTHDAEIERLGLQHRVWRPHATRAWRRAGFSSGQTILDVGCGPGYATLDLAEIVGPNGRVVAVDRSRRFLDALEAVARTRGLTNIETHELDLARDPLPDVTVDGVWTRWVYSFVSEPDALLRRATATLRPGGTMAILEYADYRAWRLWPRQAAFEAFVGDVMTSWRETGGEPDIALELPHWLEALGFDLSSIEPITELARPGDVLWEWPKAFVSVGVQRLVALGRVDAARALAIQRAFDETERTPGAFLLTPTVFDIVARKRG